MTMEKIKVVADFDWLENEETIGLLGHESQRGTDVYTFEYDKDWLKRHPSLNLGKELQYIQHNRFYLVYLLLFRCKSTTNISNLQTFMSFYGLQTKNS